MPFLQCSSHVYNVIVALVWDDFLKPDLWWPLYSEESYLTHNLSWAEVAMWLRLLEYKIEPKTGIIKFQNIHCTSLQMRYFLWITLVRNALGVMSLYSIFKRSLQIWINTNYEICLERQVTRFMPLLHGFQRDTIHVSMRLIIIPRYYITRAES